MRVGVHSNGCNDLHVHVWWFGRKISSSHFQLGGDWLAVRSVHEVRVLVHKITCSCIYTANDNYIYKIIIIIIIIWDSFRENVTFL